MRITLWGSWSWNPWTHPKPTGLSKAPSRFTSSLINPLINTTYLTSNTTRLKEPGFSAFLQKSAGLVSIYRLPFFSCKLFMHSRSQLWCLIQTDPSPQRPNGVLLARSALQQKPSVYGRITRPERSAIGKLCFDTPFYISIVSRTWYATCDAAPNGSDVPGGLCPDLRPSLRSLSIINPGTAVEKGKWNWHMLRRCERLVKNCTEQVHRPRKKRTVKPS